MGSVCAFIGAISALVYNTGIGMGPSLIVALLVGLGVGAFQGFAVLRHIPHTGLALLTGIII
ncbi:hypothetical protein AGMMS4952_24650 [Spirochaetia bacterium]|nr:hypothetical protein AGMMS4952_24650 [Spirochaetia bacterium]